jgi:hypothetical protein
LSRASYCPNILKKSATFVRLFASVWHSTIEHPCVPYLSMKYSGVHRIANRSPRPVTTSGPPRAHTSRKPSSDSASTWK